jgi:very-short-patch-repair endonuclease
MSHEIHIDRAIRGGSGSRGADAAIAALARVQHGVVARFQLLALELSDDEVQWRIDRGRLHRLHLGVYALGHLAITREGELMAAVLAGGPDALLGLASAGELWKLPLAKGRWIDVIAKSRGSRRGIRFHRRALDPTEVTDHRGIPVTTPERTILDLASQLSVERLEKLIRQAEYDHLTSPTSLASCLSAHEGARGSKRLRKALERATESQGVTREELERRFLRFIRRHKLPTPHLNHRIDLPHRTVYADCAWPQSKLIVELDSRKAHANRHAFESDRERDRDLLVAGWTTTRVTWRQLHEGEQQLAADLRAIHAAGRPAHPPGEP